MASDLDIPNALVVTNATLGMTSFVLGIHALTNHNQPKKLVRAARAANIRESRDRLQASVAPIVLTTGGQHAPGVSVNVRF
jgi:hypothetical protein